MAFSDHKILRKTLQSATAVGVFIGTMSLPALADFPGERWDAPYVQISGGGADQGALTVGLNDANQTYFYGSKPTKMQATVRGPGKVDVKIIDRSNGAVIAERRGLSYSGTGAAASQSITAAALNWMDSLSCVGDCAVASSGAAPAVQTAQAPAPAPSVETTAPEKAAPQPKETVVAAAPPKSEPKPQKAPKLTQPKPAAPKKVQPSLAARSLPKTTAPEKSPAASIVQAPTEPSTSAAEKPSGSVVAAVLPKVEKPTQEAPSVSSPSLAEPSPAAPAAPKPASGSAGTAPTVPQSEGQDADEVLAALDRQQETPRVQEVVPGVALPLPRPENLLSPLAESLGATPKPLETVQPDTTIALADPTPSATAPAASGGSLEDGAQISVGSDNQPSVSAPAATPAEPARAPEPAAVAPAQPSESPTAGTAEDSTSFQSPTPVARAPQTDPAPRAPAADVAASAPSVNATSETEPTAPAAPAEPARPTATVPAQTAEDQQPAPETEQAEVIAPAEPTVKTEAPATVEDVIDTDSGDNEQLALVNPAQPVSPPTAAQPQPSEEDTQPALSEPADTNPETTAPQADDAAQEDDIEVAAVDPNAAGPTLANARWVGFTPAVYTGSNDRTGAWIAGPFDRKQRQGWITDTATGATTRVTFIWREAGAGGRTATLSRDAAKALGLGQGDVANVAVYLPR